MATGSAESASRLGHDRRQVPIRSSSSAVRTSRRRAAASSATRRSVRQGPDFANAGAGGLEMPETIGTWRTPNITPDKGTGIGNWTDEQIIAAVREGVRPDGKKLYPIMPYMNYNVMTDDDAKALVAFLRTLKPVERTVAPNKDLKMAADRRAQAVERSRRRERSRQARPVPRVDHALQPLPLDAEEGLLAVRST